MPTWYGATLRTTGPPVLSLEIVLGIAVLSWVGVAWALLRTRTPPQQRAVSDLRGRVEDLEHDLEQLHARVSKRARQEDLATARDRHEERSKRRNDLEAQAAAIVANQQQQQPTPADPQQLRAQLRAKVLAH